MLHCHWVTPFPCKWWEALRSKIGPSPIMVAVHSCSDWAGRSGRSTAISGRQLHSIDRICTAQCKVKRRSPLVKKQGGKGIFLSSMGFPPFKVCHLLLCCLGHRDTLRASTLWWLSPLGCAPILSFSHLCPAMFTGQDRGVGNPKLGKLQEAWPCLSQGSKFLVHSLSRGTLLTKQRLKDKIVESIWWLQTIKQQVQPPSELQALCLRPLWCLPRQLVCLLPCQKGRALLVQTSA